MIWIIILVLAWGAIHSLLASVRVKDGLQRSLGPAFRRFYRLAYNIFAGLSFLPVLLVSALIPDRVLYRVPLPWSFLLVLGQGLAVLALLAGLYQSRPMEFLGLSQLGSLNAPDGKLNVQGLYRFIRHPLYTAGLAFIWLVPLMTMNLLAMNIGLTVYIILGAHLEERKLRREFGQEYLDYMAVTPMFIPFLKRNKSTAPSS